MGTRKRKVGSHLARNVSLSKEFSTVKRVSICDNLEMQI